mgnify:CR=1 FL=1
MEIYSIVLTILTILSLFEIFEQNQISNRFILRIYQSRVDFDIKKIIVLLIVISFMLISALRDISVGKDLINYIPRYTRLGESDWSNLFSVARSYSFEEGFAVFCKVLYSFNPDPTFFLIVTSIIISIGFYNLSKLSKMPIFTMFILFGFGIYGASMNIVRQFIAFSILTFSIKYITTRQLWKFLLVIIIATTFHTMTLWFLPLYVLYAIKYSRNAMISILAISIFMASFGSPLVSLLIEKTSFAWYLSGLGKGSGESILLFLFSILLLVYFYRNEIIKVNQQDNLFIWSLSLAIIFNSLALNLGIFARLMTFFTPFIAILIPDLVHAIRENKANRYLSISVGIVFIIFFVLYYQLVLMGGEAEAAQWFPYIRRQ